MTTTVPGTIYNGLIERANRAEAERDELRKALQQLRAQLDAVTARAVEDQAVSGERIRELEAERTGLREKLHGIHGGWLCKGAWALGTACGTCMRCVEHAPAEIARLRERVKELEAAASLDARVTAANVGGIVSSAIRERQRTAEEFAELEAENEQLRAALKPLADYATRWTPDWPSELQIDSQAGRPSLTIGDCRRAAELLKRAA